MLWCPLARKVYLTFFSCFSFWSLSCLLVFPLRSPLSLSAYLSISLSIPLFLCLSSSAFPNVPNVSTFLSWPVCLCLSEPSPSSISERGTSDSVLWGGCAHQHPFTEQHWGGVQVKGHRAARGGPDAEWSDGSKPDQTQHPVQQPHLGGCWRGRRGSIRGEEHKRSNPC